MKATFLVAGLALSAQEPPLAFVNARILTMEGPEIQRGTLVVGKGRVLAVGSNTSLPPTCQVRDLMGKTIMPGLVDSHSHIGCADGYMEGADPSVPLQPEVRIADGLNPFSASLRRASAGGITTVHVMPTSHFLVSGQTICLKLRHGWTLEDLAFYPHRTFVPRGLKMANGSNPRRQGSQSPGFPGTRTKSASLLREAFMAARERIRETAVGGGAEPLVEEGLRAMMEALEGKRTVHCHSHRQDDILTFLRLQKEFGFKAVLHHVSEGWAIPEAIAASGVPCSIIVVDSPGDKVEAAHCRPGTGAVLERAGILVGFHSDDPFTDCRWLFRSAALAVRYGMSREGALKALTLDNARILGLQEAVGSLRPGKHADFLVLSGDPLSVYSHVEETWVEGKKVFDRQDPAQRPYAVGGPGMTAEWVPPCGQVLHSGGQP